MASYHTVQQGEYLSGIAKQYGLTDYRVIYDHPENAEFKRRRPNPNLIYPGDRLFIPDREERQETRGTEARHKFQAKRPALWLKLVLKDKEGKPLANEAYTLKVEDRDYSGSTDGSG